MGRKRSLEPGCHGPAWVWAAVFHPTLVGNFPREHAVLPEGRGLADWSPLAYNGGIRERQQGGRGLASSLPSHATPEAGAGHWTLLCLQRSQTRAHCFPNCERCWAGQEGSAEGDQRAEPRWIPSLL